jgi:O-antigen ligase
VSAPGAVLRLGEWRDRLRLTLPAQHWFALVAVFWLPFTYAFTIPLQFPLKVYELALALAFFAALAQLRVRAAAGALRVLRPLLPFAAVAVATLAYYAFNPLPTVDSGTFDARFGAVGDGVAKLAYLALAVFGFLAFSYAAYRDLAAFVQIWIAGALAAAAYGWTLFVLSVVGLPPLLLPGMSAVQYITVAGRTYVRSGTMAEGNYFGLFLLCSVAVAVFARWRAAALVLAASILITFSTASILGLAIFVAGTAWSSFRDRESAMGRLAGRLVLASIALATLTLVAATGLASEVIIDKLTTADPGSKLDRLDQAIAGVRMAIDQPVFGVGLSQYGFHYRAYQLTSFFRGGEIIKPIPNNVYVELLSETGVVGLLLFGWFLLRLYRAARAPGSASLRWGLAAMLVVFNAFPTYTVTFLWAYWALLIAVAARARADGSADGAAARVAGRAPATV